MRATIKFAFILSEISCLQVRASHYLGLLSPSFIFSWTTIANISAYFKGIISTAVRL